MITVQLLGGAYLRSGDALLSGPPAQRHRIALLTLVIASWPQPISRDRAMVLLWPERDTANARRLLNLAVHVLRAALGEDAIADLRRRGHDVSVQPPWSLGRVSAVAREGDQLLAAANPRLMQGYAVAR